MADKNIVILAGGISSRMKKHADADFGLNEKLIEEADTKSKSMISMNDNGRPFLDHLLYNISEAGYENVLIVIGEKDQNMKEYYKDIFNKLNLFFATQFIPEGRQKPFGTADALYQGLLTAGDWNEEHFTVVNSDNLYSVKALEMMLYSSYDNAMIDYDSKGFEFKEDRVKAFAVTVKNQNGYLADIIEKPNEEEIKQAYGRDGILRVSMNIFRLKYNMIFRYLEACPAHPVRKEKELPTAIKMMLKDFPDSLYCYPLSEHVPDLTDKEDIIPTQNYIRKHYHGIKIN